MRRQANDTALVWPGGFHYSSGMRARDTFDVACGLAAAVADAAAVFAGFMLAVWIRFDTGWIPLLHDMPARRLYVYGASVATILLLLIFRSLGLLRRPQMGSFGDKIPRLVRAIGWGILLAVALAFIIRTEPPFSRVATVLSFFTVSLLVLVERYALFRLEIHFARRRQSVNRVVIVGTDAVAGRLKLAIKAEPRLRSQVVAFLRTNAEPPDPAIPPEKIRGNVTDLEPMLERQEVDEVVLADTTLPHGQMATIILACEKSLVPFLMVPDIFGMLTSRVSVQHIADVPLLGVSKWPLDYFINRAWKRLEDLLGALIGLALTLPLLAVCAWLIRRTSPGPALYFQERCGEGGKTFSICKLRTMVQNAEEETGPVWATEDDTRRTPVGAFLRQHNLDELPQFWNVLKGEMSLVGPRPERPHFVEQFKEDISRYMWRHSYKPGMTGWAQVNGLRGNTSIQERIKYDLFYLENWSLAFDFKILIQTLFSQKNAY